MKKQMIILVLVMMVLSWVACGGLSFLNKEADVSESPYSSMMTSDSSTSSSNSTSSTDTEEEDGIDPSSAITTLATDEMFTNNELTLTYDEDSATSINLSNESVTIDEEGTYIISGTLSDGQIIVDVGDSDKVYLVLDGVDITCSTSAAIYILNGDKVFITLADGSSNTLTVSGEYDAEDENGVDGVIFAKSDLSFLGTGTLEINANYGHGIVAKDDLVFMSGTYNITAASHGISANDSIRIADGEFTIVSGKDGMKADNDEDPDKGYIYIATGTINIQAEQDGISASSMLQIDDGEIVVYSGGGYVEVLNDITMGEGSGNMSQATDYLEYSMKSMKASNIEINGGNIYLSSYEDALHADYNMTINGGTLYILSGDDAVHAEETLIINDVDLVIEESYEGIEACYIYINGGSLDVNAYDDAVNATESYGLLEITGGEIWIACVGDGLDSNGDLTVTGGYIEIDNNPIYSGGDGEVDVSGDVVYTGGTIVDSDGNAIDPTSGFSSSGSSGFSQMMPSNQNSNRR